MEDLPVKEISIPDDTKYVVLLNGEVKFFAPSIEGAIRSAAILLNPGHELVEVIPTEQWQEEFSSCPSKVAL